MGLASQSNACIRGTSALLLIHAAARAEAPLTSFPSEAVVVKVHTDVRRCGAQLAGVIYTLAVSTADGRTLIRLRGIVAEQKIIRTSHLWTSISGNRRANEGASRPPPDWLMPDGCRTTVGRRRSAVDLF